MGAVWMRVRAELRGRWRAWLGLATLIGLFGGVVLASAAGARRTESAYPRFLKSQRAYDAVTFYVAFDPSFATLDPDRVEALPAVAESVRGLFFLVEGPVDAYADADGRFGRSFNRIKILEGRRPNPVAEDEASVPYTVAARLGARVGGTITMKFANAGPGGQRAGEFPITFTVVAIHAAPGEFSPGAGSQDPLVLLTPAFHRAHASALFSGGVGFLRLKEGADGFDAFRGQVESVAGGKPFFVLAQSDHTRLARKAVQPTVLALWTLAGLMAVVAMLVFGQALARQMFLESDEFPVARALGITGGQLFAVGMMRAVFVGGVAAIVAIGVASALSPLTPVGPARIVESSPGFDIDPAVLGLGAAAVVIIVALLAAYPAWRAERAVAARDQGSVRRSRLARAAFRAGLPPAVVAGVRLALERGRGRTAVPVRTTLGGATIGVAALLMAFTFGSSLDRLLATPELYGVRWDREVEVSLPEGDRSGRATKDVLARVRSASYVEQAALEDAGVPFVVDGVPAAGLAMAHADRGIAPPVREGRFPETDQEIVLGVKTLRAVGKRIGDTVEVVISGLPAETFRVVGTAALPGFDPTASLGEGSIVVYEALLRFLDDPPPPQTLFVRTPGADVADAPGRLRAIPGVNDVRQAPLPADLLNLRRVQSLPLLMAGLLALLAVAAIGHALASGVRRRAQDLAILKALGFVRGQVRAAVAWQATTLACSALLIGMPLGVAGGRWAWTAVADSLGVLASPATPLFELALVVPAAIVLAIAISALPARTAARARPAEVLRAE